MNVNKSRIDVNMHRVNIETSKKSSESFSELSKSFELSEQTSLKLSKIHSKLSSTSTD